MSVFPRIAGLCLLDTPYPVDVIYDYDIPEELDGDVLPGAFVTVPFGIKNIRRLALVMTLKDTSDYKERKSVISVCPPNLSLDREMLGLCVFMKHRTLCSTGDAVRSMIPTAALTKLITLYKIKESQVLSSPEELSEADYALYSFLSEHGETSTVAMRKEFGAGVESRWKRLFARGYLTRRTILKDAVALTEKTYTLAVTPDYAESLLSDDGEGRLTSGKQRTVLSVLLEAGEPMAMADITAAAKVTESPVKSLLQKGILLELDRRIDRNPYADIPKTGKSELILNEEQSAAVATLTELAFSGEPKAALLHGVTGSGKTCVMTALIDKLLDAGKGVILLLPEISLTPQSVAIFCSRYGDRVAVVHSGLSAGERYDAYCRIRSGEADLVIGTRSAIFSPVKNLGAIIIDEEQEHTYKSDQNPKYHTKDIARFRCADHAALMLLASATPSIESYQKATDGIYTLIRLTHRYGNTPLPRVEIADMRKEIGEGNTTPLGKQLLEELSARMEKKEQAVLFLNRRGYNHYVSCRSCGASVECPTCSVSMTYHARRKFDVGELVCHFCGRRMPLPKTCPSCGSEHLIRMGFGTQKVEEDLGKLFPQAKSLRMDTDTTSTKFSYDRMLTAFRKHEADILLGTQMVTKGHDFPDVTLVGVLLADASLYLDDYRAAERTFSMLTQVIGRAGRRDREGLAVIQTANPDSEIIRLAAEQNYEEFFKREIRLRKLLTFPPFCDIALLTVVARLETMVIQTSTLLANEIKALSKEEYPTVPYLTFGPFEAPVYKINNQYRMRMVIKCKLTRDTYDFFGRLLCRFSEKAGRLASLQIDFNPSNL